MAQKKYCYYSQLPLKMMQGFTLVELMITLFISTMIISAIFSAYLTQQRAQTAQDQVVEMQQNLRAGINFIASELRMAGFDSLPFRPAGAGIVAATNEQFQFTMDRNRNGNIPNAFTDRIATDPGEMVGYDFSNVDDANNDGIADNGAAPIERQINDGLGVQPVAENIGAIEFLYVLPDTSNNGIYDPTTTLAPTATQRTLIRAVTISMLARAANSDPNFSGNTRFTTASGALWGPFPDNFRRRLIVTTIQLRNMGL